MSIFALLGDIIDFICQFVRFGRPGDEYSDIILIFACVIYLAIDLYYLFFIYHLRIHTPDRIKGPLTEAYYGSTSNLVAALNQGISSTKKSLAKIGGVYK